jgi:hypothetical protein
MLPAPVPTVDGLIQFRLLGALAYDADDRIVARVAQRIRAFQRQDGIAAGLLEHRLFAKRGFNRYAVLHGAYLTTA